ncbi:MAG: formyltransferase [Candidatus Binatia bacterium]
MKLAVFAYHDIGYECLKTLIEWSEEIVGVVTHKDNPNEEIWFRSVAELARSHGLPVFTPRNPNTPEFVNLMRGLGPELILSCYYRKILSKELLAIPRLGGINLHGSFLPKYRGRCPVNWVLINGEPESGVTLHYMIDKADAGDIVAQKPVAIEIEDTALTLFHKLTAAATQLLRETYPLIKAGTAQRIPQNSRLATTFGGRRPEDGKISWELSALEIHNLIRAVTHPYPGAFTSYSGRKLYLWGSAYYRQASVENGGPPGKIESVEKGKGMVVSTGKGSLLVTRVQFEGEEEMSADELVGHHGVSTGMQLGE